MDDVNAMKSGVIGCISISPAALNTTFFNIMQGRSQDFSKGGAEIMEAKAMKRKNCLS